MNFVGAGDFRAIGAEFLKYFIELGGLKPNDRVLDAGCGIGRMAVPLTTYLNKDGSYEGFDVVADGINWCAERISSQYPNFHFLLADVYNQNYNPKGKYKASQFRFPYESESFDFVFLTSVFTHLLPEDLENYLTEIARVLKRNGRCLTTYFLLNAESSQLMAANKSIVDFKYDLGSHRVQDLTMPEAAVCYDERLIQDLYRKSGLNIKRPIHYGSWCGRPEFLSGQDIIVASKEAVDARVADSEQGITEQIERRQMPKCSIIIPVHNRASLTRQCLNSLLARPPTGCDFEIIVVDDASTDLTPSSLSEYGNQIRVIRHLTNMGFASSCNDGAAIASGEYLVFLNNDTIPGDRWLDALLSYVTSHSKAAVVGSKLLFPNDTIQHAGVVIGQDRWPRHIYAGFPADHPAVNKSRRFQIVTAACALVRRETFEQVGGFDTAFVTGAEDVDLCLRLGERGYEVHYCHDSVLYHLESVSPRLSNLDEHNGRLYQSRWAHRVQPDDLDYYLEDGLLRVSYPEMSYSMLYPVHLTVSPLLAVVDQEARSPQADQLIAARSRQVFELLKENIRLNLRLQEGERQK